VSNLTRAPLLLPLVRIASGVLLGMGALGLFAAIVAARDAGMLWLVLDLALITVAIAVVAVGIAVLRETQARSALLRGWVTVGAAILLIVALFISLD
jgi:hypothetical protein